MAKKAQEYEFWVCCSGRGELPKGRKVGKITVKTKSTDLETIKDKAYEQLAPMIPDPKFFDLELI